MRAAMSEIRIAVAGVGNCASALLQGIEFYRRHGDQGSQDAGGLLHYDVQGYTPGSLRVVAAFDIDARKVGRPLEAACFVPPNCTKIFQPKLPRYGVRVAMGPILDGVADHMGDHPAHRTFVIAKARPVQVARHLRETGAEILLNYLPVGSERATAQYAEACLQTGVSLINCMPVFIVSDPRWARRFAAAGIPVVGDDIKAQLGATIVHRTLAKLCCDRGVKIERTYQLNTGGNTDFLNMLNQERLHSKRISKTQAVQSQLNVPLAAENIHIGPSDYVPWQNDNKVCFLRIEGRGFGGVPLELDLRLSVEDSPNSAGVAIDAIRCCRLARDRGVSGPLGAIAAWTMKHPPEQMDDHAAKIAVEAFIQGPSAVAAGTSGNGHSHHAATPRRGSRVNGRRRPVRLRA